MSKCPYCGHRLNRHTVTFESKANSFFKNAAAIAEPKPTGIGMPATTGNVYSKRESTDFMPTIESHVNVPWQQAVIKGGLVGGLIFVTTVGTIWTITYIDWGQVLTIASRNPLYALKSVGLLKLTGLAIATSASAAIFVTLKHFAIQTGYYDDIINRVEEFTKSDLNGNGVIGGELETPIEVTMPAPKGAHTIVYADLPGPRRKLVGFAWLVLHPAYRVNFSYYGAETARYGKSNFGKLSQIFIDRKWAFVKDESVINSPLVLTRTGKEVLFRLAKEAPEQLPDDVDLTGPTLNDDGSLIGRYTHIKEQK